MTVDNKELHSIGPKPVPVDIHFHLPLGSQLQVRHLKQQFFCCSQEKGDYERNRLEI